MSVINKNTHQIARNEGHSTDAHAKIRVGGRGGAYIPSAEIANLPEVREMQRMAMQIVGKGNNLIRK